MCAKFGQKIPNRLGKMSEKIRGGGFDSHCISEQFTYYMAYMYIGTNLTS